MPCRKIPLVKGELYHIVNKSIAGFKIFNRDQDYKRMMDEIAFYLMEKPPCKFSMFAKLREKAKLGNPKVDLLERLVKIISYCLMPTHLHFILEELKEGGITKFMNAILKSYSQYFNKKHNRKGPLWEGRFDNILVETDEQFIHLTRYIHLNPVTAHLVNKPEDWKYSCYREYIDLVKESNKLCNFSGYFNMAIQEYVKFVHDRIGYQRELAQIKHLTLE